MTQQVLRARLTLPIVLACLALGTAAAGWLAPSAYEVKLVGHWKPMLPMLPFVAGLVIGAWCCSRPRVVVDQDGVRMRRLLGWVALRWDDIDRYNYMAMTPANSRAASPGSAVASATVGAISAVARARAGRTPHRYLEHGMLRLTARDGRTIRFGPGLFFDRVRVAEVFDRALGELHGRLRARPELAFAPVRIHGGELVHPGMPAPLALTSISKVVIADRLNGFSVLHEAAMFKGATATVPWLESRLIDVANVWLLVDALRSRGVAVEIEAGVFVPADIDPADARKK